MCNSNPEEKKFLIKEINQNREGDTSTNNENTNRVDLVREKFNSKTTKQPITKITKLTRRK